MMGAATEAVAIKVAHPDEDVLYGVDFTPLLTGSDGAEVLTGTPTGVEVTSTDLTISAVAVNTVTFKDDDGVTIAVGKGVQLRIDGQLDGVQYEITVTAASASPDSNTRVVVCKLVGEA